MVLTNRETEMKHKRMEKSRPKQKQKQQQQKKFLRHTMFFGLFKKSNIFIFIIINSILFGVCRTQEKKINASIKLKKKKLLLILCRYVVIKLADKQF